MNDITYIPDRFKKVIWTHIIKQSLPDYQNAPLLLGIHGPSGVGKTYQCEKALQQIGTKIFLISGGELENSNAGQPAELIRNTYIRAGDELIAEKCSSAAIVINDIDASIGNWGDMVQYTVNRQTVFGELMNLADYPTQVSSRKTQRIPIILTGNDFTKLYDPLIRAGRMISFEWIPTAEDKVGIVNKIYTEKLTINESIELISTLEEFNSAPLSIAFFSSLQSAAMDDLLWIEIIRHGAKNVLDNNRRGIPLKTPLLVSLDRYVKIGKELITSSKFKNHLKD